MVGWSSQANGKPEELTGRSGVWISPTPTKLPPTQLLLGGHTSGLHGWVNRILLGYLVESNINSSLNYLEMIAWKVCFSKMQNVKAIVLTTLEFQNYFWVDISIPLRGYPKEVDSEPIRMNVWLKLIIPFTFKWIIDCAILPKRKVIFTHWTHPGIVIAIYILWNAASCPCSNITGFVIMCGKFKRLVELNITFAVIALIQNNSWEDTNWRLMVYEGKGICHIFHLNIPKGTGLVLHALPDTECEESLSKGFGFKVSRFHFCR